MNDITLLNILVSYLALKAGVTPEEFAKIRNSSKDKEVKEAVDFWNKVVKLSEYV